MKKFFLLIALVAVGFAAQAQHQLQGVVKDSITGQTLPGANIIVKGTFTGTFSDSDGAFVITGLEDKKQTFEVSYLGYTSKTFELNPAETSRKEVQLARQTFLAKEVIVQATRASEFTPATYTNVTSEEIEQRNFGQDMPIVLSMTPSMITSSDAGAGVGYTWMNIRGSDNSRINITVNGIPVNDAESHGVWWVNMPDFASSSENIQIQRGVGVSTQGAASFGATISVKTLGLSENPYGEIITSGGSFNTLRNTVKFGTGLLDGKWAFDGRLSRIVSDGFIDRASSDLKSFYLSGGYYGEKTVLQAITFSGTETTYQAWNGVPGNVLDTNRRFNPSGMYFDDNGTMQFYDNETDNYQQDHYQLHFTHEIDLTFNLNTSLHYTYGRGYYEQYREDEAFSDYSLENPVIDGIEFTSTDLIRQRWLDNHFYGATWSLNYNDLSRFTTTLGGGYNIYEGDHFGEIIWARLAPNFNKDYRFYENDARKTDFNSFLKSNYRLTSSLSLFADLQYRRIVYDFDGLALIEGVVGSLAQQEVFNFFNPKAGIKFNIDDTHELYGFAGISNREPVRRDFTESSPESRPKHETLRNIETGYRFNSEMMKWGVNFYLMDYKDQLILTGQINDVGGFTRTNIEDSYRMGVEFQGSLLLGDRVDWNGNLTLSRNKIPEFTEYSDVYDANWNYTGVETDTYTDTDIAFSPSVVAGSNFNYNPFRTFEISWFSKYVGDQYIDNTMNENRKLDAYWVNDLAFSYLFANDLLSALEIGLMINNVLNVDYITNAWIYKGYVGSGDLSVISDGYFPQAGRHFLVSLRLKI